MIHRDISPDNIMIRRDGQVKLIDFGAARVAQEEDEKSLTVMLKRGFSPEEQYRSKGHQGPWTDIYALCATMYYMLTGVIPPESMERVLEDKYVSLKEYDIELDTKIADAIDKGLCVLAKNRYQSMSDLIHDIYGEEEKLVIPKKDMASMEVESAVGETVLDDNSTVLMDDENKTVLMDEAEEINPIVVGKNKIVKFNGKKKIFAVIVLLAIVLIGGTFSFIAQNSGNKEELANVASKENAVTTPTVSPTPTAEITATPEVLMPNLVNQKIEEITPQIQSIQQGANIKTIEVYSNTVPVGNIVSQLPEAGSLLNPSQPLVVTLEVSKGEELMTVPNVKGKSLTTAKSKLKKSGLKLKTKSKYSSSYSKGKVISQNKKASAKVKKNTTIQLVVSKGPKPTKKPQATPRPTVRPQRPTTSSGKSSKKSKKSNKSSDFQVIGSDDYIELDTIEKAYQIIVSENVEIVCFGFNKVNTKGKIVEKNIPRMGKNVFKNSEIILDFLPNLISENPKTGKSSNLNMSAWAAVYSMKLIKENNWKFVSEREIISEDVYSLLNLYRNVKKVAILEEALYYYCENNTSLTKVYRKDRYERIEYCYKRCAELCKKIGYPVEIESRIIYPYIGNTIAALKQIVGSNNNFEEKINELKKIIYSNTLQQVLRIAKNNKVNMSKKILFFCIRKKMIKLMYLLIYIKQRVKNYEN